MRGGQHRYRTNK